MNLLTRRALFRGGAAVAGSLLLPETLQAVPKPSFHFVHITDAHIQPEFGATQGVKKAFAAIRALPQRPAFGLVGGDLVMDAALVPRSRADMVYDLWQQESADLGVRYITGGAICGDWWKGKRLGVHPEGFSVVTITGDDLTWKYIPYGWKARS